MSDQYVQGLIPKIRAILEGSDLSTVSAKAVRKRLVSGGEDEVTIKASRGAIDEEISTIYDQLTSAATPSPPSSPDEPLRPKAEPGSSQPQSLHVKREVKPAINEEVDPETDEQMARRLQLEYNDQASSSRPRRANATAPAKKKKKATKKRLSRADADSGDEDGGEGKKKKRKTEPNPNNPFNKEMILSDALADLVSAPRLSRPQVVKQIWAYVKENGFQDQSDKRYILCDEKLKKVFHTDRLHMFTMNKILVDHLRNPDDVIFKNENESKNGIKDEMPPSSAPIPLSIQPVQDIIDDESEEESDDENY
ncbi:hypothetical protein I204_00679 [Kwoniella mangroviensis CBS 8886]|uniref:uncharacterized protein n=1 Tax=Kwoniella mangroviensis CBS 8507 TaxID=1296122 RepID=UPI00080CE987|nr:uncharacterized protein I203_07074 [Kwoniella mangroviensis CBS 8507]OCF63755.1 hypothetical protein I203_07074 [Kwoniella mangroviensis CBS 8507]OCF78735.1 hypothetical protein I204_00679 [Kwoniella mangroviensis CBS 8886]